MEINIFLSSPHGPQCCVHSEYVNALGKNRCPQRGLWAWDAPLMKWMAVTLSYLPEVPPPTWGSLWRQEKIIYSHKKCHYYACTNGPHNAFYYNYKWFSQMKNLQTVFPEMVFPKMNNIQTFSSALKSAIALVKIITSFPCSAALYFSERQIHFCF